MNRCVALPLLLPLVSGGCSAFVSSRQSVTVRARPSDAEIRIDGKLLGRGEVRAELERNRAHLVTVEHEGRTSAHVLDHVWSTVGKVDAVASMVILFPGVGLFFAGARRLEPRELVVDLSQPAEPTPALD